MSLDQPPRNGGSLYLLTTSLAAVLNLFAVGLIGFVVLPEVRDAKVELQTVNAALKAQQVTSERQMKIMDRLNDAMDANAARLKAVESKQKGK